MKQTVKTIVSKKKIIKLSGREFFAALGVDPSETKCITIKSGYTRRGGYASTPIRPDDDLEVHWSITPKGKQQNKKAKK